MRLLLTSGGVKNPSIHRALVDLLGRPIAESNALCIPTAGYGHPMVTPAGVWRFISGNSGNPMCDLGWKSLGVLELTALPSIDRERWVSWVHEADVLLANGGDALYLTHWMRQSGLADLLPALGDKLWVGLSAGSMVMTPRIGSDFVGWKSPTGDDRALGIVGFSIFPHLGFMENTVAAAEAWAAEVAVPAYAIDDETAIQVVDGEIEVISEGTWRQFTPDLPILELASPGPLRDSGINAILDGTKTALTGLLAIFEHDGEALPAIGDRYRVVDSDGQPAAVIEMTHVDTEPISAVTDDFAHAEGRGYRDAAHWRTAHEQFFRSDPVAQFLGHVPDITDDTLVVTQRFRLVEGRPPTIQRA